MKIKEIFRFYCAAALGSVLSVIKVRTNFGFSLSTNTREMIGRKLFTFGFWEPNLTQFIRERVREGTQFIDVGTNIGYFSLLAEMLGADVRGIEASPEMSQLASRNLADTGGKGRIMNAACAAEEGEVVLYESRLTLNPGARTILPNGCPVHARVQSAPLLTLVDLDPARPCFIKIDIEGAERPALLELVELIANSPEIDLTIVAEIAKENRDLLQLFTQRGCRVSLLPNDYSNEAYSSFSGQCLLVPLDQQHSVPEPFDFVIESPAALARVGD
ncbi:MAG: FkbM family methyltransferase [Verrucomicrobiaceae bacterium]|nr:MAG: FkbM family methyltransferase [Verrucomicrobiaceae bacterium]